MLMVCLAKKPSFSSVSTMMVLVSSSIVFLLTVGFMIVVELQPLASVLRGMLMLFLVVMFFRS